MVMHDLDQLYQEFRLAMSSGDLRRIEELIADVEAHESTAAVIVRPIMQSGLALRSGDAATALERATEAKALALEQRAVRWEILANLQRIFAYQALHDPVTVLELCFENLHLDETINEPGVKGALYSTIGLTYRETGDYAASLEYLEKALNDFTQRGATAFIANTTCNIGGLYFYMERYDEAAAILERGVAMQREVGNTAYEIGQSLALAKVYFSLDRAEDSWQLLNEMHQKATEMNLDDLVANAIADKARLFVYEGRFEDAISLLEANKEVIDRFPQWAFERDTVLGTALLNLKQYDESKRLFTEALERTTALGIKGHMQNFHRLLRDAAKEQGDFDAYIRHNEAQQRLAEELNGAETARKVALLEGEKRITALNHERERERALLYAALPKHVADRMVRGEEVSDQFERAAVLFADVVGFTTHSSQLHPAEVTTFLERLFRAFDEICQQHGVTKVKTIGDSYLCFAGSDVGDRISDVGDRISDIGVQQRTASPEQRVAAVALAMQQAEFYWPREASLEDSLERLAFRIGIHSGPVAAGVIGTERLQYDIWGDTVNMASRMESSGEPGRIQVSESFAKGLRAKGDGHNNTAADASLTLRPYTLAPRGEVHIKGKGLVTTYWLEVG